MTDRSPAECLEIALDHLEELGDPPRDRFKGTMYMCHALTAVCKYMAASPGATLPERARAIAGMHDELNRAITVIGIDAGRPDEYTISDLAERRSGAAFLADAFGTDPFDAEVVEEVDEELANAVAAVGAPGDVPEGIPESHWWWLGPPPG